MCDASTVGQLSTGAQAVGTVASTYGAYTKAVADKTAYNYQAVIAQNNAELATYQAKDAETRGADALNQQQLKNAQLKGTQRARLAANGVDLGQGSALDLLSDTDQLGTIDANTIKDNTNKEAWALRAQAGNYTANADLLQQRADSTSPFGAAAGAFLTGTGGVAKSWYTMLNPSTKK